MKRLLLAVVLLFTFVATAFAGRIIYVKPDGSVDNDGTGGWSVATTLPHALANFQQDDELRLSKGIHYVVEKYAAQPYSQFIFQKENGQWDAVNEFGQNQTGTPLTWDLLGEGTCGESGKYIRGSVQQFATGGLMLIVR